MNRVILITGGSRGIGAATAVQAAARGYTVCLTYQHQREAADLVVASIVQQGGTALAVQGDVGSEDDILRLFATIDTQFGRLDALVNNAGVLDAQSRLDAMSVARMQRIFTTNILGSFLCAREAVRRMSTRYGGEGGAIVNVSSRAGSLGAPGEYIDYAASKGALNTLTVGLAKEVAAEGIRVNAVCPGIIYTEIHASGGEPGRADRLGPQIPMLRSGTAEEVANTIIWLLSDEASYVTGTLLDVAGGR
jgi:NAD(P)-dependent dehydrogenase (short-subunit alcohol dehydrogenase family)